MKVVVGSGCEYIELVLLVIGATHETAMLLTCTSFGSIRVFTLRNTISRVCSLISVDGVVE